METIQIIAWISLIFIGGCIAIIFGAAFLSMFDHKKWSKNSVPSLDATIVDIKTEKIKYLKNGAKYKTTVLFSDGFSFITHKTNREDELFSYTISVGGELLKQIIRKAEATHEKAVRKKIANQKNQTKNTYTTSIKSNKVKPTFPGWLSLLVAPHHIVAIVGIITSIVLNICIPQENVMFLAIAMGFMLVELVIMLVLSSVWNIPGSKLSFLPYFAAVALAFVISKIFQFENQFDEYILTARLAPFAATISLSIWVRSLSVWVKHSRG